jgi:hypothetical protein
MDPEGFFKAYEEYAKTLRTWLVAYGIGGPVLVLGNERLWGGLVKSGVQKWVGGLFLIGVGMQVILTSLNKMINWVNYASLEDKLKPREESWLVRLSGWLSGEIWIDFIIDIISISLFIAATYLVFVNVV